MKLSILLSLFATTSVAQVIKRDASSNLRIMNWNLRNDGKPNDITIDETINNLPKNVPNDENVSFYTDYEEAPWSDRRIGVANEVLFNSPDVFTVNEALHRQVEDLKELLGWPYIGVGRDDGGESGEYEAIYYNPSKLNLISNDTFWLSDKPFEPSKYPGAGYYRDATVCLFEDSSNGVQFVIINVHLDDESDDQRKYAAALVKYRAGYEYQDKHVPVFLVGDFNSQTSGKSCAAYEITTGSLDFDVSKLNTTFTEKYKNDLSKISLNDLMKAAAPKDRMGHHATFTGFKSDTSSFSRIDFQFGSDPHNGDKLLWEVVRYKGGDNWYDDSFYLSDHRPVITDLIIKN
ncbi:unnamed protein product [Ambrosiozyma monospora]|uniref:Unnamed protein product n=1 Tax=Ambrosiozyma monospora TaxID=43982 RepID=A0ACB5SV49_AMBMO|nr:unnamed protein product [Ambrosiozyma monospora]